MVQLDRWDLRAEPNPEAGPEERDEGATDRVSQPGQIQGLWCLRFSADMGWAPLFHCCFWEFERVSSVLHTSVSVCVPGE